MTGRFSYIFDPLLIYWCLAHLLEPDTNSLRALLLSSSPICCIKDSSSMQSSSSLIAYAEVAKRGSFDIILSSWSWIANQLSQRSLTQRLPRQILEQNYANDIMITLFNPGLIDRIRVLRTRTATLKSNTSRKLFDVVAADIFTSEYFVDVTLKSKIVNHFEVGI